jgi:hypothetical protein
LRKPRRNSLLPGDGILAEFDSVVNAVECGVAIQKTLGSAQRQCYAIPRCPRYWPQTLARVLPPIGTQIAVSTPRARLGCEGQ